MCFLPQHDNAEDSSCRGISCGNEGIALLQCFLSVGGCTSWTVCG